MGRPDIYSPINVTEKETDLSRFHKLKSCSYLFPVKKCFQVDQQHIFSHREDFERAELLQLRHERPLRTTAYLVSRLCALGGAMKGGKILYILEPAVVVGRGVGAEIHRGLLEESEQLRLMSAGQGGASRGLIKT